MIDGYSFDYVSYKMGAEFAYKVEELENERNELLNKIKMIKSLPLVDIRDVYNSLCTYKDENGVKRRFPDYDVDNFENTIPVKTIRNILCKIKTINLEG